MGFKIGAVMGFGVGYYLGAKAGRERYQQIDEWLHKARESEFVETAVDKAKAVADLGVERARDLMHRNGDDESAGTNGASYPSMGSTQA